MIVTVLEWDSNFFHRNINSVTLEPDDTVEQWKQAISSSQADLIYLKFPDDLSINQKCYLNSLKPDTSVTNITFRKDTGVEDDQEEKAIQPVCCENEILCSLVLNCGKFSRFYLDQILCCDYARLYKQWLKNAFIKKNWYCITFSEDKNVAGLCVFSRDAENSGHIELLTVDERFQKRSIGQKLLRAAENILVRHYGIQQMFVDTQINNIPACRCYEKFGFLPYKQTHIYHLWRKK